MPKAYVESPSERRNLDELLNEARLLLPGTEVFLAFLMVLPFYDRFHELDAVQHGVYLTTFLGELLALSCFLAPAAYHRIARPLHDKERFKVFATKLIILGLLPFSTSLVGASYLVCSVVTPPAAPVVAIAFAVVIATLWWVAPLLRVHDRFALGEGGG
jgi:hypothetical protein